MAVIYLYRRTGITSNRYRKFPDHFEVCGYSTVDWWVLDVPGIASRIWTCLDRPASHTFYALSSRRTENGNPRKYVNDLLHRVIWELVFGSVPLDREIDHINRNGLDNRIENLRLASHQQNGWNIPKDPSTRFPHFGVDTKVTSSGRIRYQSYTSHQRRKVHLGCYESVDEAGLAFNCAVDATRDSIASRNKIPPDSISPARQQEIRSIVERKLRERSLIPSEN
jgi:hypothetical protein